MTYYQDLSAYNYFRNEPHTLNVGWLDNAYPFLTGNVPALFVERLSHYLRYPVNNVFLGVHRCNICKGPASTGEIRVFGVGDIVYAAPTLIVHYVRDHIYYPPEEFIQAVLDSPLPSAPEYKEKAKNHLWCEFTQYWPE